MSFALATCLPDEHANMRSAVDLSTYLVNEMSWKFALPVPWPVPMCALPELLTPQLQARTSIDSAYLSSFDSPLMPSSCINISTAITTLLHFVVRCSVQT